jgi:hypothetical protein
MRLADDEITITLGSNRVFVLRASLRAAFHLHQAYGSYGALSNAIAGGSFSALCDVVTVACTDRDALVRFREATDQLALRDAILDNRDKLLEFVLILAGGKRSGDDEPSEPTKPITFEEYHAKLFGIAAGVLGWTPETAWNATASEILTAYHARIEFVGRIFGGKNDQTETIDTTDASARAQLNALGDLGVTRLSEVR